MKYLFFLLIATVGLIFNTSCSSPKPDTGKPAVITVTIEPLRYFTEAIAGDKFDIVSMVPDGSSPETYDPTPQQLVALAQSKAYFQIGHIGFEQTWMQRLQANAPHLLFYDMSENVPLMEGTCHETHQHNHDHNVDPHIWNSTKNAEIIVKNIYHALCQLDSIHQTYYAHRLDSVTTLIRETEKQVQVLMQDADRTFLIYHPALTYFARDYNLQQISIENNGKEPTPAHLQSLIRASRENKARVIFVQQEFDQRNAETIAKELDVNVIPIHPLSYNWQEEIIKIARALNHNHKTE